jgi:hypothetical protein
MLTRQINYIDDQDTGGDSGHPALFFRAFAARITAATERIGSSGFLIMPC